MAWSPACRPTSHMARTGCGPGPGHHPADLALVGEGVARSTFEVCANLAASRRGIVYSPTGHPPPERVEWQPCCKSTCSGRCACWPTCTPHRFRAPAQDAAAPGPISCCTASRRSSAITWPSSFGPTRAEDVARPNLRRHLHDLRRALPAPPADPPWLLAEGETVQWNPDAAWWLDVAEFERLGATPEGLAAAVALYTEDLLPEVYDDWIFFERERLRNLLFAHLERLTAWHEAQGDIKRAIAYARPGVAPRSPARGDGPRAHGAALSGRRPQRGFAGIPALRAEPSAGAGACRRCRRPGRSTRRLPRARRCLGRRQSGTGAAVRPRPSSSLPAQVVSFIGRETELAELAALTLSGRRKRQRPLPAADPDRRGRQRQNPAEHRAGWARPQRDAGHLPRWRAVCPALRRPQRCHPGDARPSRMRWASGKPRGPASWKM